MWIWFSAHNYLLVISFSVNEPRVTTPLSWETCWCCLCHTVLVRDRFVGFLIWSLWWSVWRGIKGLCEQCSAALPCCFLGQWSCSISARVRWAGESDEYASSWRVCLQAVSAKVCSCLCTCCQAGYWSAAKGWVVSSVHREGQRGPTDLQIPLRGGEG